MQRGKAGEWVAWHVGGLQGLHAKIRVTPRLGIGTWTSCPRSHVRLPAIMASSTTGARCGRVSIAHTSRYVTTRTTLPEELLRLPLLRRPPPHSARVPLLHSAPGPIHSPTTSHSWPRLRFRPGLGPATFFPRFNRKLLGPFDPGNAHTARRILFLAVRARTVRTKRNFCLSSRREQKCKSYWRGCSKRLTVLWRFLADFSVDASVGIGSGLIEKEYSSGRVFSVVGCEYRGHRFEFWIFNDENWIFNYEFWVSSY